MIHPYQQLVNYEGNDLKDYLNKIYLLSIFSAVVEQYPNDYKGVVKYILYAYSIDSDMLLIGEEWSKACPRIFKHTLLPQDLYEDVALLKSSSVLSVIEKWLKFQNDENFTNYCHFRDLRFQMLQSSLSNILKNTGEIDYEQKMKNSIHSKELLAMMKESIDSFIQNHPIMKESIKAFNKANNMNSKTMGVEGMLKEYNNSK